MYPQNLNFITFKRFKSKEGSAKYDEDEEINEQSLEDEYLYTSKSKIIETTIPSLRLDVVAKAGLAMSRAKFDKEFYKSNIRLNGQKCLKKNITVQIEDEIDHVQKQSPDNPKFILVNRCKVASVSVESDAIKVKLIQDKSLLIENYDDQWTGGR